MVYAGIFLLAALLALVFARIMLYLTDFKNAERYPLGGFMPATLIIFDLGYHSAILGAGIATMGGLFGYYLLITIWEKYMLKGPVPDVPESLKTEIGVSVRDYLK